jgi:hypothetical protein
MPERSVAGPPREPGPDAMWLTVVPLMTAAWDGAAATALDGRLGRRQAALAPVTAATLPTLFTPVAAGVLKSGALRPKLEGASVELEAPGATRSHPRAQSAKMMMTMTNRTQFLGVTFAVMRCTAFAAAPALAQHAATDRSGEGGGFADNAAAKSEAPFNGVDPGGDHGSANWSRAVDARHIGVSAHDGFGIEASHAGAAPAGAPGMTAPRPDAGANTDLGPISLEGFTGLQRRANRNALIANVPKISGRPPASIGISAPFKFSGANGGTGRNARRAIGACCFQRAAIAKALLRNRAPSVATNSPGCRPSRS